MTKEELQLLAAFAKDVGTLAELVGAVFERNNAIAEASTARSLRDSLQKYQVKFAMLAMWVPEASTKTFDPRLLG